MATLIRMACFLALTAAYLTLGAKPFYSCWANHCEFQSWAAAVTALSPAVNNTMALSAVPFAVLLFACMSLSTFSLISVALLIEALELLGRDLLRGVERLRTRVRTTTPSRR